jgi:hypothetical protein
MATKPDGKPAKVERVVFTRPAAERIAKVVRSVEGGDRDQAGITYGSDSAYAPKVFRVCTFTGAWAIDTAKTVTFRNVTSTPNTVSAYNLFCDLPNYGQRACSVAKAGTAWYLVASQFTSVDVVVGATLGTAGLTFTRSLLRVPATATATSISIGTTACT